MSRTAVALGSTGLVAASGRTLLRRAGLALGAALLGAVAYLTLWPVPIEPRTWSAPHAPGYTGAHETNTRLSRLDGTSLGSEFGPEHIAIGPDGKLYAAMTSGTLLRMDVDGTHQEAFANTGGRVLGFAFDADGRMIAADAMRGLLAITRDARVTVLADHITPNDPIQYANSVVVARDGVIYFTDASGRFAPRHWGGTYEASLLDVLEQSSTGRVLAYEPVSKQVHVVAHGFSFANGIALSSDERSLFVSETGRYRIWKVDRAATDLDVQSGAAGAHPFLTNLPGYPDNVMRGLDGRIWVGLFRPRNPAADGLAGHPWVRKILWRLPHSMIPVGKPYSHVFAFDETGRVVEDLQDPSGAYPETTGATETSTRLYIHSLHAHTLGWSRR